MTSAVQALRACLNPRVLVGLGLVGAAIVLFVPGIAATAIPLLILAACPLSMAAMMLAMRGHNSTQTQAAPAPGAAELRAEIGEIDARRELLEHELAALPAQGDVPHLDPGSQSVPTAG